MIRAEDLFADLDSLLRVAPGLRQQRLVSSGQGEREKLVSLCSLDGPRAAAGLRRGEQGARPALRVRRLRGSSAASDARQENGRQENDREGEAGRRGPHGESPGHEITSRTLEPSARTPETDRCTRPRHGSTVPLRPSGRAPRRGAI